MKSQPIPPPSVPWSPSVLGALATVAAGGLGWFSARFGSSFESQLGLFVGMQLLWGLGVAGLIYTQWSRPLTHLFQYGLDQEAYVSPAGASLVRSVQQAVSVKYQTLLNQHEQFKRGWENGLQALVQGQAMGEAPPEIQKAGVLIQKLIAKQYQQFKGDLSRIIATQEAARDSAWRLGQHLKEVGTRWNSALDAAARAETRLSNASDELEARFRREEARIASFESAFEAFQLGVGRLANNASALSAQVYRAKDVGARELAREARLARGERAPPIEAPPIHIWAADLESLARDLMSLVTQLEQTPRLEPARWTSGEQEALASMVACGRGAVSALDAHADVAKLLQHWVSIHEEDQRLMWYRVRRVILEETDPMPPELELEEILEELEERADSARQRLDAIIARTTRILHSVRSV